MATKPVKTGSPAPSPFEERRLPVLLRSAWYALNQTFRRRIAHLGITPDQFTALRWISESGPDALTQRELTDRMTSDPNTIASLLSRMERDGLIERQPCDSDRRANRVHVTDKGRRAFDQAKVVAAELQAHVLESAVPTAERDLFLEQLANLGRVAREALNDSPRP